MSKGEINKKFIINWLKENFYGKEPKKWIVQSVLEIIILGIALSMIGIFIINPIVNPNPKIGLSCYIGDNQSITLVLDNPSNSPAEKVNLLFPIKLTYFGSSFPTADLCNIASYSLLPQNATKIYCDYLPPKSKAVITVNNGGSYIDKFSYSLWGETTTETAWSTINCHQGITNGIRKLEE